MSRTLAVLGATGQQGGAVARACLQSGDWKVRGITRNVRGQSAQTLAGAGAEVVAGDIDDIDSLLHAFSVGRFSNLFLDVPKESTNRAMRVSGCSRHLLCHQFLGAS